MLLQVTVILACAELYFSSLGKVLEQRRVLQQQLKQADEGLSECQKRLRGVDGTINQLQVCLGHSFQQEHMIQGCVWAAYPGSVPHPLMIADHPVG